MRVIEGYGALPALGLLDQVQIGDTGPAESTRRGNLQRVGLLFLGSRDSFLTKKNKNIIFFKIILIKHLVKITILKNKIKMLI